MRLMLIMTSMFVGCSPMLTPLEPHATQALVVTPSRTRVLWVLDNSGSLNTPIDPASSQCPAACGAGFPCPSGCVTRKMLISDGLELFAASVVSDEHIAIPFPQGKTPAVCEGPSTAFPVQASELAPSFAIRVATGGTPTGAALTFASSLTAEGFTDTIVVLVTDGFPNCNPNNAHNIGTGPGGNGDGPDQIQACRCVSGSCTSTLCSLGCIDDLGTAAAANAFTPLGYQLMVLTIGPDFETSVAPYSDMKIDLAPSDSKTYRVRTALDFNLPAARLDRALKESHRCTWWLDREVTRDTLSVSLEGNMVPDSEWSFRGEGAHQRVVLTGTACQRLLADPTLTPGLGYSVAENL